MTVHVEADTLEVVRRLRQAATAKKCWRCGCFHGTLDAIERERPEAERTDELNAAVHEGQERLVPVEYDCLGCETCYPAIATNILGLEGECVAAPVEERIGWPPLPGTYRVCRYQAPVAICTLTSDALYEELARATIAGVALAGSLCTENLGIERIIVNILANPHIRFLIVCGADSRQAVGHLPGQSLVSLAKEGIDERGRIIGARGKRPRLRNVSRDAVEHFRRTVEVIDLIGTEDLRAIRDAVELCLRRNPGPAKSFLAMQTVRREAGCLPQRMEPDPSGYFVVYVDQSKHALLIEHYQNNGVLDVIIEGRSAAELYTRAIGLQLLSRLDHAAYLGRELARAELAAASGTSYVQDGAPPVPRSQTATDRGCTTKCSREVS